MKFRTLFLSATLVGIFGLTAAAFAQAPKKHHAAHPAASASPQAHATSAAGVAQPSAQASQAATKPTRKQLREERRKEALQSGEIHTRSELKNFDAFLDANPSIRADLTAKPGLVNDPSYVKSHPELQTFFKKHPYASQAVHENPGKFMHRETRYGATHP